MKKLITLALLTICSFTNATEFASTFDCENQFKKDDMKVFLIKNHKEITRIVTDDINVDFKNPYKLHPIDSNDMTLWLNTGESHDDIRDYSTMILIEHDDLKKAFNRSEFWMKKITKGIQEGEVYKCSLIE